MILDTVLVIEAKNAKNNYLKNYVNSNLTENDIIFEENSIKICGNTVGSYKSSGSYHIVNSYLYSESDMLIICKAIAKHMGDEDEYQRLYDEWLSHNYGYYAFLIMEYLDLLIKFRYFCQIKTLWIHVLMLIFEMNLKLA